MSDILTGRTFMPTPKCARRISTVWRWAAFVSSDTVSIVLAESEFPAAPAARCAVAYQT